MWGEAEGRSVGCPVTTRLTRPLLHLLPLSVVRSAAPRHPVYIPKEKRQSSSRKEDGKKSKQIVKTETRGEGGFGQVRTVWRITVVAGRTWLEEAFRTGTDCERSLIATNKLFRFFL